MTTTNMNWGAAKLYECTSRIIDNRGKTPPPAADGIPIITAANVRDGHIDLTKARSFISEDDYLHWMSSGELDRGDILFTTEAPLGNVATVPPGRYAIAQRVVAIRANEGVVHSEFLAQYLRSDIGRRAIATLGTGSTAKGIKLSVLKKLTIPLPPHHIQHQIARFASTSDSAINLTTSLLDCKQLLRRALMQRLLTSDESGTHGSRFQWRLRPLSDFFTSFNEPNGTQDRLPLSCSKVHGIVPQSQIFGKRLASSNARRYKVVRRGDLVFDPMLLWDASIGFVERVHEGIVSPAYSTFHFNDGQGSREFFRIVIASSLMRRFYKSLSRGTNKRRKKVLAKDFVSIAIPVPDLALQAQIGQLFSLVDTEISLLRRQLDVLRAQKRGVINELLSAHHSMT